VDALHGIAEQGGNLARPAQRLDECCVFVHDAITRHVNSEVNSACINKTLSEGKMRAMQESAKRLFDAAREATRGSAAPITNWKQLGLALGETPQVISNWKNRSPGVSKEGAIKAERLYGVSVDWVLHGTRTGKSTGLPRSQAQLLSLDSHTVPPRTLLWGDLMKTTLPRQFRVALPDDAMAPDAKAGELVEMDTGEKPRPGDGVLVQDAAGAIYFRKYRPGRGDAWTAYATNPDYPSLESERDGLEIIATMIHVVRGRWG